MKRLSFIFFTILILLLLAACSDSRETVPAETKPVTIPTTEAYVETTVPATEPLPTETTVPPTEPSPPETTAATEPLHSDLYIPGVNVEDVITYFNEICLHAEFVNSGNPSFLQKWTSPIYYRLHGPFTAEDYDTITQFAESLNAIPGFPGIQESPEDLMTNLSIFFCDERSMIDLMGENFRGMDGGVTFWYDSSNSIYDAIICYRTDLDQYLRNSVILEEIYNGLGPIEDTILRSDSIVYSEFAEPQELTEIDWLILKLMYLPEMECGMDAFECEAVIRSFYY